MGLPVPDDEPVVMTGRKVDDPAWRRWRASRAGRAGWAGKSPEQRSAQAERWQTAGARARHEHTAERNRIAEIVAAAPPLSDAQKLVLRELLRSFVPDEQS